MSVAGREALAEKRKKQALNSEQRRQRMQRFHETKTQETGTPNRSASVEISMTMTDDNDSPMFQTMTVQCFKIFHK